MVYCRSCGKQVTQSMTWCPGCGTLQSGSLGNQVQRNLFVLMLVGFGWTIVMWFLAIVLAGCLAGLANPGAGGEAGRHVGAVLGGPMLLVSLVVSIVMTAKGLLPGSSKTR